MAAQRIGGISVSIVADTAKFHKAIAGARGMLRKMESSMLRVSKASAKMAAAIAAPLVASIKFASDAQETMSKFNVVFGKSSELMENFARDTAAAMGRSRYEIAGTLASFQDLFVPMGVSADMAQEMSKQLTTLSVDLASFNNMADASVVRDLQAAMTGSGETMKKYGVIVSEAAVKQELLRKNIAPKEATEAQKAIARLTIIMQGTTAAQGDAVRTAGGFANQLKALKSSVYDTAVEVGNALLPSVTRFVAVARGAMARVMEFVQNNGDLIRSLGKLAITLGVVSAATRTLSFLLGKMSVAMGIATKAAQLLGRALLFISKNPMVLTATLITAALLKLTGVFDMIAKKVEEATGMIKDFNDELAATPPANVAKKERKGIPDKTLYYELRSHSGRAPVRMKNLLQPHLNRPSERIVQRQWEGFVDAVSNATAAAFDASRTSTLGRNIRDFGSQALGGLLGARDSLVRGYASLPAVIGSALSNKLSMDRDGGRGSMGGMSTRALSLADANSSAGYSQRVAALRQTEQTQKKQLKTQEAMEMHLRKMAASISGGLALVPTDLGAV